MFSFFFLLQRRNNRTMAKAKATMRRIGLRLVEERKREFEAEQRPHQQEECLRLRTQAEEDGSGGCEKTEVEVDRSVLGRDLLSVLSASNPLLSDRSTS
jgi:hypothetical protein